VIIRETNSTIAEKMIGKIDTLVIPFGTVEIHGPHGSLMSDGIVPERIAEEADKIAGDRVYIAPLIPYGHTPFTKDFPGSHTVPTRTLADFAFEVVKGFQSWKIKNVILFTGHGGNSDALRDAAERAADLGLRTMVLAWWDSGFRERYKGIAEDLDGHSGEAETAILLYLGDKFADKKLIPRESQSYPPQPVAGVATSVFTPELNAISGPRGYAGKPIAATAEEGRLLVQNAANVLVEVIDALRTGKIDKETN
jgi:creatinine amidohydrolase